MSGPNKYREWILETIDSLRSRKARPDLERICRMVRRRHGSDPDRTRAELEKLIQEQTVLKVSYKGSISYRNAAKVQRKSRKKSEFPAAGGGGGADAAAERSKRDHPSNNGDSAHSLTDQEEGQEDPQPSPGLRTKRLKPSSSPSSGNLACGATTSCAAGSGCEEEKASAPRDEGLGQLSAEGCPSPGFSPPAGARDGREAEAAGGGKEPDPAGAERKSQTYSSSSSSLPPRQTPQQTLPLKRKLGLTGGSAEPAGRPADSVLGDKLVASVRSLSERSLRPGATRGHMKPLGLKEILGYLSSQERLSEEKLTRGKVKVVMEREVARGRLRRTRCGNITLSLRGMVPEEPPPRDSATDRLAGSALQGRHSVKKENEPMETASEEEEQGGNDDGEEEENPQRCDEEGGLLPVASTTQPGLTGKTTEDAGIQKASEEGSQQQLQAEKGVSETDCPPKSQSSPVQRACLSQCNGAHLEESAVAPGHLPTATESPTQHDDIKHTSADFNGSECKTEVGVSSCMLTPSASPRDSSLSDERGSGVTSGELMKPEGVRGSPVDWTVSDVVSYITAAGFPEQAAAFRTQEIDGKSLLLMQRNDVLTGLSIRLGPALKIYERHIKVLQKTHFEDDDC